ncbi:INO80 complex subunit B-like isoform X2 [Macrosteles quadrilineatus]|uniref:INO80 complex subunit B-like isoform X2 n=1 Tax=Macrosteles quadrilineatus TaxID=74068 RepID=UPI0023E305A5|nr:INO80 complex subunit B-like isoform X2 [Macrosteles quadrilineatus]
MGKRKDTSTEEEAMLGDFISMAVKKHKKHKHKKHKKKKSELDSESKVDLLKLGLISANEDDPDTLSISTTVSKPASTSTSPSKSSSKKKKKGKESATSSEEERWLDAIESGKLEEVDDELKKIKPKDPKLMTARQRAMLERKTTDKEPGSSGEQLLALPTGYREKVMTPEMALKAQIKSQKRKQQADEKREKDKKKTMERLLRKQESKPVKMSAKGRAVRRQVPTVTLTNNLQGIAITLPPDIEFPLKPLSYPWSPSPGLIALPGYSVFRNDRLGKTGGGVAVYVKDGLQARQLYESPGVDLLTLYLNVLYLAAKILEGIPAQKLASLFVAYNAIRKTSA